MVGDTHTIQALNAAAPPVTGLTWVSSDPTTLTVSTDNPPLLTALAAREKLPSQPGLIALSLF